MDNIASYIAVSGSRGGHTLVANRPARAISCSVGYTAQPESERFTRTSPRTAAVAP